MFIILRIKYDFSENKHLNKFTIIVTFSLYLSIFLHSDTNKVCHKFDKNNQNIFTIRYNLVRQKLLNHFFHKSYAFTYLKGRY